MFKFGHLLLRPLYLCVCLFVCFPPGLQGTGKNNKVERIMKGITATFHVAAPQMASEDYLVDE